MPKLNPAEFYTSYGTERTYTPGAFPELWRKATREDVLDANVSGFWAANGDYWRKNGAVKLWKTRPTEFRVPVKYGLYDYDYVDQSSIIYCYLPTPDHGPYPCR